MKEFHIAVIPGDGIGKEVVPAGKVVLNTVAEVHGGFKLKYDEFPWSCEYYSQHKVMMPENALEILKGYDAIYLGAVGSPDVPDHISLWGLLIPIRRHFQQYINLRPVKLFEGVKSPLADCKPEDIDFVVIRENNEGEYSDIGGRIYSGTERELVVQNSIFTRYGVEKVIRYAFEYAKATGRKRVTAATKSNGISYTMPFWDEIFAEISSEYPSIEADKFHIDTLTAKFVLNPGHFDVVVGSNLFGDILSDLGPAIAGSLGIAASANLNPEKKFPSMFEPVHGSAPDIVGKGIANPVGQIWSGALMLEHLGYPDAKELIMQAIQNTLKKHIYTPDLGGTASTQDVTSAITEEITKIC